MGIGSWIQRLRLRDRASFKISDEVATAYRRLRYDPEAAMGICYMPLSTIFWADEHPGGLYAEFSGLDETRLSILRMVGARSCLWANGEVPRELERVWAEAKATLPDWPGFQRLTLTRELLDLVLKVEVDSEAFWDGLSEGATESRTFTDATGISQLEAYYDLTKEEKPEP